MFAKKQNVCKQMLWPLINKGLTKKDLYALLLKTPILDNMSEEKSEEYEKIPIEHDIFEHYVSENTTEKGIKLIRRYYGIIGKK